MTDLKKIFHSFGINDLLNASTSGLVLFKKEKSPDSLEGRIVCTVDNKSARTLTGFESLSGMEWADFIGQTDQVQEPIQDTDIEVLFKRSNTWCRISNVPVDDHHFLCTITDISQRKLLESKNTFDFRLLREAENTMRFGSWTWDPETEEIEWSDGVYYMLGYTPKEEKPITYELLKKHLHPDDVDIVTNTLTKVLEQQTYTFEARIITREKEERYVMVRGQGVLDEIKGRTVYIGNIFDITSLKLIQNELEGKVSDLNKSNADLEQFAYVASHDLQEPLRKIVSFGERLDSRSRGTLNEEQTLYLDRILNATRRMQEMIENLLEFSRVARTKDGFTQTDLNAILQSVVSDLEITIQQKNAIVKMGDLPVIEAIPTQMSQLFINLLSNSLKFTRPEVRPVITIKAEVVKGADTIIQSRPYVKITIQDNGIGFQNDQSSRIFTLFQRLRGRSEFEGAGIGLSVCKKVVENHQGTIEAYGVPDEGATFTVQLPISQS